MKRVNCQRITSKNTRPWWVDTWARDTVRWYWSADTLFWQLSIDDNIDVQSAFSWAPKVARKCESKHWYACGADGRAAGGRAVYGHVITKSSGMGRFTYPWCSAGALRAPELRYYIAKQWESCLACQPLLAAVCNSSDVCPSVFHKIKKVNDMNYRWIRKYIINAWTFTLN